MSELTEKLRTELQDREYREGYDEAFLDFKIATQIRVIREQRGWNQKDLAKAAGMSQSRISEMEDQDYGSWSVNTLRRLAYALGVRLNVEFEEWGNLLREVDEASREDLQRRSFEEDPAFLTSSMPDEQFVKSTTGEGTLTFVVTKTPKLVEVPAQSLGLHSMKYYNRVFKKSHPMMTLSYSPKKHVPGEPPVTVNFFNSPLQYSSMFGATPLMQTKIGAGKHG